MSSPQTFNLYSQAILRELEALLKFIFGGHDLNNIKFGDETVLIADIKEECTRTPREGSKVWKAVKES